MTELTDVVPPSVRNGDITSSRSDNEERPETEDLRWGWRSFRPRCLQCFNSSLGLLTILSTCSITYGMSVNGFNIAAITTLEKRFHLNSKQTGLMASIGDVSSMIVTIIVSFYGSFGHKPRWIGICVSFVGFSLILFAVPHFLVGKYDPPEAKSRSQFCQERNTTEEVCDGDSKSVSLTYFILFLISQIISGGGSAPLFSLGIAFLDENVNPKYTSMYLAVYYATGFLGPSIGFILAGQLLSTYVDITQPDGVNLTPFDPRWIGNWWIGPLVSGFFVFFLALLILAYPRQLPGAMARRQQAIENNDIPGKNEKISGNFKDVIPATRNLVVNPVYMFQTLGVLPQVILGSGVGPFFYKLIRINYGASQALAGVGVGLIGSLSSAFGTLVGSLFGRNSKLKESCKVAAKYSFYLQLFGMWMGFMFLVPGCSDLRVPGAHENSSYDERCNCKAAKYVPVCSGDVTYYSACDAGCPNQNVSSKVYTNCTLASWSQNASSTAEATLGECDRDCKNLVVFIAGFTLLLMLSYLNDIPGKVVTIRSVPENQRSYALGFQLVIWRALGSLPGPVIFGSFIDKSCILWRKSCGKTGDCLAYKTQGVVFVIIIASVTLQLLSIISFLLSWYFACKSFPLASELNHSHHNGDTSTSIDGNGDYSQGNGVPGLENPVGVEKIIEGERISREFETKF